MIVYLQSMQIVQLDAFKKEIAEFPLETREDLFSLKLSKSIKILKFWSLRLKMIVGTGEQFQQLCQENT